MWKGLSMNPSPVLSDAPIWQLHTSQGWHAAGWRFMLADENGALYSPYESHINVAERHRLPDNGILESYCAKGHARPVPECLCGVYFHPTLADVQIHAQGFAELGRPEKPVILRVLLKDIAPPPSSRHWTAGWRSASAWHVGAYRHEAGATPLDVVHAVGHRYHIPCGETGAAFTVEQLDRGYEARNAAKPRLFPGAAE